MSPRDAEAGRSLWSLGLAAAVVAAVVNVGVYIVARFAGVPLELTEIFDPEFQRIPVVSFVLATLLEGGAGATATAVACRRWARHPRRSFIALAVLGLLVSLVPPAISDGTTATKVVLYISHVATAAIIIPVLGVALPSRAIAQRVARG